MNATNPVPTTEPQYLTLPEASRRTGLSIDTLRNRVKDGTIPSAMVAGKYRIRIEDLDAWMQGRAA